MFLVYMLNESTAVSVLLEWTPVSLFAVGIKLKVK